MSSTTIGFGREKRLLLGTLALLAPIPLPFNEVLSWPALALYAAALLAFLRRAWRDPGGWLPGWAMNLLGLAYLPVLYLDLVVFWGGQLVRPVIHLALFTVVVKLFALRRERDKWHVFGGCFFLFLAAMGTSVHPSILLYLLAVLAVVLTLLTRFSYYSVLGRFGYRQGDLARVPLGGFVAGSIAGVLLVGAPLFALLPRLRTPYLVVRGGGTGTIVGAVGFSDLVTLDSIGSTRASRQVMMRLRFQPQPQPRREIRVKAVTYDGYDGRSWRATRGSEPLSPDPYGIFRLDEGTASQRVEVWLLPWNSMSLPLPVQALAVQISRTPAIGRDPGGAAHLYFVPGSTFRYDVELADQPAFASLPAPRLAAGEPTLALAGLTPRVAELASRVVGEGTPMQRAKRLEAYLSRQYRYSTEFIGRSGQLPLERFLFEEREGHCEYFATAMVMMLRSQGIPARFVTGFYGGEPNAFEGYYVVRQSNAHAWVEAWIEGSGWEVFDPTPPMGRPGTAQQDLGLLMGQVWDYLLFRWDRYVLTFGLGDQLEMLLRVRSLWMSMWQLLSRDQDPAAVTPTVSELPSGETAAPTAGSGWHALGPRGLAALALVAGGAACWWLWRLRRRRPTATAAYLGLRRRLQRGGVIVPESLPPLRLAGVASTRYPAAAAATGRLIHLYLRESFAGESLSEAELAAATASLREVSAALERAG